jgi:hypothetical protein
MSGGVKVVNITQQRKDAVMESFHYFLEIYQDIIPIDVQELVIFAHLKTKFKDEGIAALVVEVADAKNENE